MQIQTALNEAAQRFSGISDTGKLDAEVLLCHVLDCSRTYLFTWPDKSLSQNQYAEFEKLCRRRDAGEPVAHIVGYRDFWSLSLEVNSSTLIPRPDTERLVEAALDIALAMKTESNLTPKKGLDLGTGTGAIALALASELPDWQWLGVDYSEEAVALARRNLVKNEIENCQFAQSNWFCNLEAVKYDLIVANPPYIDSNDPHLNLGDVRFEPRSALIANESGLADIRLIIDKARGYLLASAAVVIEHGFTQGPRVRSLFAEYGYTGINTVKDLSGNDRVSIGYLK